MQCRKGEHCLAFVLNCLTKPFGYMYSRSPYMEDFYFMKIKLSLGHKVLRIVHIHGAKTTKNQTPLVTWSKSEDALHMCSTRGV